MVGYDCGMRANRAEKATHPWRMAIVLASVTAGAALVTWSGDARHRCHCPYARSSAFSHVPAYVHVQLAGDAMTRDEAAAHWASIAQIQSLAGHAEPLFAELAPDVVDPRARWIRVEVPVATLPDWLHFLTSDTRFAQAFVEPDVALPNRPAIDHRPTTDDSCPINTPSFESYQGYLGPAPHGIDAPAAWLLGHRGAGVWFADIEGGWNAKHEDLPGDRITHAGGRPYTDPGWRAHGTAVLGEVVAKDNGKGVVGIAPDVERVFTSSIGGTSVANAIDVAARKLRAGDVLLIELQTTGPRRRYIPVEWYDDVYTAIVAATKRGVVVVEAAGNGAENLDLDVYRKKFDREKRDSGAIMVGAGGPPRGGFRDRERLDFSNYGGRVDVQGWGRMVATLDYGDLQDCSGDTDYRDRHYTKLFAGTSSASPIVAGAAVILEGIAREDGGKPIAPRVLRELLRRTGTPQAGNTREHIGPRPDLARAIPELRR